MRQHNTSNTKGSVTDIGVGEIKEPMMMLNRTTIIVHPNETLNIKQHFSEQTRRLMRRKVQKQSDNTEAINDLSHRRIILTKTHSSIL